MLQSEALSILKTGVNVFLTGEPGSGKSYTVNQYVSYLLSCGVEPDVTASTGIAATHIDGVTIHSWCGIGVKSTITNQDLAAIAGKEYVVRRVRRAQILIIDEISMLSADTLSSVDRVCQELRENPASFGGLQVVLVGDFFQLPPVVRKDDHDHHQSPGLFAKPQIQKQAVPFAFCAGAWKQGNFTICYLSEQHRREDPAFLDTLSAIRRGVVTDSVHGCLGSRCVATMPSETLTRLFPHNTDVDRINEAELAKLPGDPEIFAMESGGVPMLVQSLKRNCISPESLMLKQGAKVIFTKNSPDGAFVNGTTGHIVGYAEGSDYPVVKVRGGRKILAEPAEWKITEGTRTLAKISQIPLRLAWAITVHKSQGMSLDAAIMDLRQAFEYGQGYVALSRVRTLAGLHLLGYNQRALEIHPEVASEDVIFRQQSQQAQQVLNAADPGDLAGKQAAFISVCGGKIGKSLKQKKDAAPGATQEATRQLIAKKLPLKAIAKERGLSIGTIITHLEKLAAQRKINPERDLIHMIEDPQRLALAQAAFETVFSQHGGLPLSPARDFLGEDFSFDELRFARLFVKVPQSPTNA